MNKYNSSEIINIGSGKDIMIRELAQLVKKTVGFSGKIVWDFSKPDGSPKKQLDVSKLLNLGWYPKTSLEKGIKKEYEWYLNNLTI